jgi:hypothetical protein
MEIGREIEAQIQEIAAKHNLDPQACAERVVQEILRLHGLTWSSAASTQPVAMLDRIAESMQSEREQGTPTV